MADIPEPPERGFAYGTPRGAALGGLGGSSYGSQRAKRYRARITTADGRRTDISAVLAIDLVYSHSAISDVSLTVPRVEGLSDFKFGDLDIFYGDRLLFQGILEKFPGPGIGEEAELAGRGPARELARGDLTVTFSNIEAWKAIRRVWENNTTFSSTVFRPDAPTMLTEFEASGTPLEVLQKLHERAGMRFVVQHTTPGKVVSSFVPGELVRAGDWTAIDHGSSGDVTDYANSVVVYGGTNDQNVRVSGSAADQAEIDAFGEIVWRIDDRSITTNADAQARAETELAQRLNEDSLSGELEIIPEVFLPGYHYQIPEWERNGTTPTLSVDEVSFSESPGEATATVKVNAPEGLADAVAELQAQQTDLQQPGDVSSGAGDTTEPTGPTIIDSWENGNLAEYVEENGGFEVVTGESADAYDGSAYLKHPATDEQSIIVSAPGDGLDSYFPKGNEARITVASSGIDSNERRILFGVEDPASAANCYAAELYDASGDRQLRIKKRSGGSETEVATSSIGSSDLANNTWHEVVITRDDGTLGGVDNDITVELIEDPAGAATTLGSVSANDATYAGNSGVGIWNNNASGEETWFDFFRIP